VVLCERELVEEEDGLATLNDAARRRGTKLGPDAREKRLAEGLDHLVELLRRVEGVAVLEGVNHAREVDGQMRRRRRRAHARKNLARELIACRLRNHGSLRADRARGVNARSATRESVCAVLDTHTDIDRLCDALRHVRFTHGCIKN
jgi:selenocysteine lyase/cysteine desulfurase